MDNSHEGYKICVDRKTDSAAASGDSSAGVIQEIGA